MLVDTSAWIEFLRATGSPTHHAVRELVRTDAPTAVCDPVSLEVLAGARSNAHLRELRALLARSRHLRTTDADWETAAQIYRTGRRRGLTVRTLMDCLIAAIALRAGETVLHDDTDFDAIGTITGLDVRRT